ncbi:hypothetical protein HYALB_00008220 [Hymenoscyphus albidus]|uniref:Uncharacterized protein n=1 Tax=Hymenoscyphus albidus TaxID=595503 RepID=A0A9N9Q5D8_9HELO|nr:hypothetical protein HYALB_00008220 [Hymenoscyphus albidus]
MGISAQFAIDPALMNPFANFVPLAPASTGLSLNSFANFPFEVNNNTSFAGFPKVSVPFGPLFQGTQAFNAFPLGGNRMGPISQLTAHPSLAPTAAPRSYLNFLRHRAQNQARKPFIQRLANSQRCPLPFDFGAGNEDSYPEIYALDRLDIVGGRKPQKAHKLPENLQNSQRHPLPFRFEEPEDEDSYSEMLALDDREVVNIKGARKGDKLVNKLSKGKLLRQEIPASMKKAGIKRKAPIDSGSRTEEQHASPAKVRRINEEAPQSFQPRPVTRVEALKNYAPIAPMQRATPQPARAPAPTSNPTAKPIFKLAPGRGNERARLGVAEETVNAFQPSRSFQTQPQPAARVGPFERWVPLVPKPASKPTPEPTKPILKPVEPFKRWIPLAPKPAPKLTKPILKLAPVTIELDVSEFPTSFPLSSPLSSPSSPPYSPSPSVPSSSGSEHPPGALRRGSSIGSDPFADWHGDEEIFSQPRRLRSSATPSVSPKSQVSPRRRRARVSRSVSSTRRSARIRTESRKKREASGELGGEAKKVKC